VCPCCPHNIISNAASTAAAAFRLLRTVSREIRLTHATAGCPVHSTNTILTTPTNRCASGCSIDAENCRPPRDPRSPRHMGAAGGPVHRGVPWLMRGFTLRQIPMSPAS
jgi:hypothetical protein